ncbi:MAG: MFS transporter [candidate division Zixibacteria bacterium]|nr:MFS transporter [candidate division Zixibacteria bacterium]
MLQRQLQFFRQFDPRLWVLVAGWFVAALGFAASIPFLSIYFHSELGLSTSQIGLFFAAQAIVRSIFQAVGGEMSDRMGRQGILIHSQTIRALSFLLLGMSIAYHWGYWWITALFTVNSIFGSLFMPAVHSLVADILPPEKRLYGYAVARSANNLGWAVGPAIGGYLAKASYPSLFYLSAVLTLVSALIFRYFLKVPPLTNAPTDKFRMRDLLAVKDDKNLAIHAVLTLLLYLVVAQLIAPFSVYAVSMVGISETQLGFLFTLNGLMVALLQIPITRLFAHKTFTYQLALGSIFYFVGYGMLGILIGFEYFIFALFVVTLGEVIMSPPGLTLTSRLAPPGRLGRYLGIRGFMETAGWSLGPLYGGVILDQYGAHPAIAWLMISSLALVAALGYWHFGKSLPREYNVKE